MAKKKEKAAVVIPTTPEEKQKLFEQKIMETEKAHGKRSVMFMESEDDAIDLNIEVIPTGIPQIDRCTGVGGIPRGRITEILGPEMSGKTTLSLHTVAECQRLGGNAVFVDAEHSLDKRHVRNCGVDMKRLLINQPGSGEEALDIVEQFVPVSDIIVVDSVAALVPQAEIDGEMGDSHMGLQARLMSQAMRKLTGVIARSNTVVIFLNQIRFKIGVMFGNPETTTGGNALKFYSSMRIDMRRIGTDKSDGIAVSNQVRAKFIKNKVAPPFTETEFTMYFDAGKTRAASVIEFGSKVGIIQKSGSFYSYRDERIGQGLAKSVEFLIQSPELLDELYQQCTAKLYEPIATLDDVI